MCWKASKQRQQDNTQNIGGRMAQEVVGNIHMDIYNRAAAVSLFV